MINKIDSDVSIFINLKKIIVLIWESDRKYLFMTLIAAIIFGLVPATSLVIMQNIINLIQNTESSFKNILPFILIYIGIDVFQTIFQAFLGYYNTKFSLNFNLEIKEKLLHTASNLNLKQYEDSEVYNLIQRAQYESGSKLLIYFNMFVTILSNIVTSITYLLILIQFQILILPIIMVFPIIKYLISDNINKKQFRVIRERTDDERKASYYSWLITSGNSYKELKLYNLFDYFIKRYQKLIKRFNKEDLDISKEVLMKLSLFNLFEHTLNGILFSYIIYKGILGYILIGDVITYTRTVMSTQGQIQNILHMSSNIRKESLYINQLFDFIDLSNDNIKTDKDNINHYIEIDQINEIRVNNLYYRYKQNKDYVLQDITLVLKRNQTYTIIGENGSGKTTLAKILLGFYDDYEGEILINGINLKCINKNSYFEKVGSLFQDYIKYEGSFRENISYGNIDLINKNDRILELSNKFNITHIIEKEERYIDTQLGFWFDSGKQISLGEWQKIALSRSYAKNADLYILDEPNAALDPISEFNVAKLYKELFVNKIGIIIAHRFSNFIKDVDNIIVLDKGKIIEKGNHQDLTMLGQVYKQFYDLQGKNRNDKNLL